MPKVAVASFNVWGIDPNHDVAGYVTQACARVGPDMASILAMGFQEVWFQAQLDSILKAWVGGGATRSSFTRVQCYASSPSSPWKCLVPDVGAAGIPGYRLELSSGLALCVRGTVRDAFFTRFRGGYTPDSFANKGVLCALVVPAGAPAVAIIDTHFHDYSNDAFGGARRNNIEALASVVKWIDANWRVPVTVVGDFNIDSRVAHGTAPSVHTMLYRQLIQLRKAPGQYWYDVNAHVHAPMPVVTQNGGSGAIDLHLLSSDAGISDVTFDTFVCGSDHQLVQSTWTTP